MPEIASARGVYRFPDPTMWPRDEVRRFQEATGARSLFDVSVFMHGTVAALYMEDAILGASILPISPGQWRTHLGYPILTFQPSKLAEYKAKLWAAGYRVVVMEPVLGQWQGRVVDIGVAREALRKWA